MIGSLLGAAFGYSIVLMMDGISKRDKRQAFHHGLVTVIIGFAIVFHIFGKES